MGEANRRGTFEERKAAAIAKANKERAIEIMEKDAGPAPLTKNQVIALAMIQAMFEWRK